MDKRPICLSKLRKVPKQFSWVDQRLVRERYLDQLSHEACTLYLFLVTVADAQGLSFYSDQALCQRLSMTSAVLSQARQALIACTLVAYQRPPLPGLGPRSRCAEAHRGTPAPVPARRR